MAAKVVRKSTWFCNESHVCFLTTLHYVIYTSASINSSRFPDINMGVQVGLYGDCTPMSGNWCGAGLKCVWQQQYYSKCLPITDTAAPPTSATRTGCITNNSVPARQGGAVTNFDTGSFASQHCLGNTNARKAFDCAHAGGITSAKAKNAIATNKWVAINDVNLGGFDKWTHCGKCVEVTAKWTKTGHAPIKTTLGPLLIADRCSECPDAAIDLKSAAYADLGIPRGAIQPGQTDGGTTKMETSWRFVSCDDPYKIVRQ